MAKRTRHLLADRFLEDEDGRVVDLATGWPVRCVVLPEVAAVETTDWQATRLDEWQKGTDLIDFGWHGSQRFEARALLRPGGLVPAPEARPPDDGRLGALVEALEHAFGAGPRRLVVSLAPGAAGLSTWLAWARVVRHHGVVPVASSLGATTLRFDDLLSGRSVALFCADEERWGPSRALEDDKARMLARLASGGARLALVVVQPTSAGASGRAGAPAGTAPRVDAPVGGASVAADGPRRGPHHHARDAAGPPGAREAALRLFRAGRHAAAVRRLESALAHEARRGAHSGSLDMRVSLAGWWLAQGDLRRVEHVLGVVAALDQRATPAALADATRLLGLVRIEQARLDEADRLLRFAVEMAAGHEDAGLVVASAVALVRGLFWQGRYADAREALVRVGSFAAQPADDVARERWWSRVALAEGQIEEAGLAIRRALDHAAALPADTDEATPWLAARVDAMRVSAAIGDLEGVEAHWQAGRRVARRCPAVARTRACLARLEAATAIGDRRAMAEAAGRLGRQVDAPPLLAARVRLALGAARGRAHLAASRFLVAHGVVVPPVRAGSAGGVRVFDDLMELIAWCQEADEERPVLDRVCARVRERVRASVVSLVADSARGETIAGAGQARYPFGETARRAMLTGTAVGASRVNDAVEAAVPVRWGGAPIAALSCRWPLDVEVDETRVKPLLEGAAVACAPTVRALLDRVAVPAANEADLGLVGTGRAMVLVREQVRRAALAPFPVLVEGESGSGKELVARAIHSCGPRRARRLAAVNCAALSDDLLEAELFGHTRGAFTGAAYDRVGLFEEADGGTLFLDEVSELSARAQAKLLRALQEGEVRRVGENLARRVDVRVVAATNRGLSGEVAHGRFREDLRYRLDVIRIHVPPLRDRPEDLPLLAAHFWAAATARLGSRATLDPRTVAALSGYDWPGNVRELQNVLASVAVHAPRRGRVGPRHLPPAIAGAQVRGPRLDAARRTLDADLVRSALARANGCRTKAATELGVSRQGLGKLIARLGLDTPA